MILPIVAYGHKALRDENIDINDMTDDIKSLITNMFETMYEANGVGLAAPQVNKNYRLFIVDTSPMYDEDEEYDEEEKKEMEVYKDFRKIFINPIIENETGKNVEIEEGCLSIPGIREKVSRKEIIKISYYDENFNYYDEEYSGFRARVIQHEYDHIEGILFTDHLSNLRKKLIQKKLDNISNRKILSNYKMIYPNKK